MQICAPGVSNYRWFEMKTTCIPMCFPSSSILSDHVKSPTAVGSQIDRRPDDRLRAQQDSIRITGQTWQIPPSVPPCTGTMDANHIGKRGVNSSRLGARYSRVHNTAPASVSTHEGSDHAFNSHQKQSHLKIEEELTCEVFSTLLV